MTKTLTLMSITYDRDAKRLGQPPYDLTDYENNGRVGNIYSFYDMRWAIETAESLSIQIGNIPIKIRLPNEKGEIDMSNWKVYNPEMVKYIHVWGPESIPNEQNDEVPIWYVGRFDSDNNEILHTTYYTVDEAVRSAIKIADRLDIELVNEAMEA